MCIIERICFIISKTNITPSGYISNINCIQRRATQESTISNTRHTFGDGDRGEGGAIREGPISNARYTIRDSDRGERGALRESTLTNARNAIRDGDRGEGFTLVESLLTNARDWTIEGNDPLAVLVGVAYDICTKDIGGIRSDDIAIGGGIGDLPG